MSGTTPPGGPKRVGAYLTSGLGQALARHTDATSRLQALWQASVPEPLASHTHPVGYAAGRLTVHADSPVWGSRLRQQQLALRARLREDGGLRELTELQIRVVPPETAIRRPAPSPVGQPRLSRVAGKLIRSVAAGVSHAGLRAALERLADASDGAPAGNRPQPR